MLQNLGFASVTSCTSFCENIRLETGERARILRLFFFRAYCCNAVLSPQCKPAWKDDTCALTEAGFRTGEYHAVHSTMKENEGFLIREVAMLTDDEIWKAKMFCCQSALSVLRSNPPQDTHREV